MDSNVPLGKCRPNDLFKLHKIGPDGLAREWHVIKQHYQLISEMLDVSKGRVPKQKVLSHQLDSWLKKNGMTWAFRDVERAVSDLRCMFQSLLSLRRNDTPAPRNYPTLQVLIDRIQLEEGTAELRSPAHSRTPTPASRPPPSASECPSSASTDGDDLDADLLFANPCSRSGSTQNSDASLRSVPSPFQGFTMKSTSRPPSWASPLASSASAPASASASSSGLASSASPALLDAKRLAQLAQGQVGPSPNEYKDLNEDIKQKRPRPRTSDGDELEPSPAAPPAETSGRKAKMRRPAASKANVQNADADLQAALMAMAAKDDPIKPYLNVKGVAFATLKNRAHSKAWHLAVGLCEAKGMSGDEAKSQGSKFASIQVGRWLAAVGHA